MVRGGIVAFRLLPATMARLTKNRPWNRGSAARRRVINVGDFDCLAEMQRSSGGSYRIGLLPAPSLFRVLHAFRLIRQIRVQATAHTGASECWRRSSVVHAGFLGRIRCASVAEFWSAEQRAAAGHDPVALHRHA